MPLHIQALIFHKDSFSKRSADQWLRRHQFLRIKPFHETVNYFPARIREPDDDLYEYRTKRFKPGIKAIIGISRF